MEIKRIQLLIAITITVIILQMGDGGVMGNLVFKVQNKFKVNGVKQRMSVLRTHDIQRHRRRHLSALNVHMDGDSNAQAIGLYFANIFLGTPPKAFHVHIDTGSETLWVNCAGCKECPTKSDLGVKLHLYDPAQSTTSKKLQCKVKDAEADCPFNMTYVDKDSASGNLVSDLLYLPQVTGDFEAKSLLNASVVFGCATKVHGKGIQESALDGLLGFSRDNQSIIYQLGESGKVKKKFAHCLNGEDGGGIFAIGEVVSPKFKTTPLVPDDAGFNVNLTKIDVDGEVLQLPKEVVKANEGGLHATLDSGTTMMYVPDGVYKPLINKILERQPGIKILESNDEGTCIKYTDNVDDKFPAITFHFENSLGLTMYPHDYLIAEKDNKYMCLAMSSDFTDDSEKKIDFLILGDVALQNKLVVHDLENDTIGWTEFDCSSRIKMRDESTGAEYFVSANDVSIAQRLTFGKVLMFLSILVVML